MMKSEYAIEQLKRRLDGAGPVTIRSLIDQAWQFSDDGDPRWLGYAVRKLDDAGEVRHVTCDPDHDHSDECTIEWVAL